MTSGDCGRVDLREPNLCGFRPIYIEVKLRAVEDLMYVKIHRARNALQLGQNPVRKGPAGFDVVSRELKVDRGGKSEIQNLGDDIGRQNIEDSSGEFARKSLSQGANVVGGRAMLRLRVTRMSASHVPICPELL